MVSQTDIAVVKSNGHAGSPKMRTRNGIKKLKPNSKAAAKKARANKPAEPAGTDVVPVMKLKAIDLVDTQGDNKNNAQAALPYSASDASEVIHMPPPDAPQNSLAAGDPLVTDPELLELLHQLSETIDTANTVLEAAGPAPTPEDLPGIDTMTGQGGEQVEKPEPAPETEYPAPSEEELPLAAAGDFPSPPPQLKQPNRFGFGLFLNSAISGLILTAGAAWLVYTNPWLLEPDEIAIKPGVEAAAQIETAKDQASLAEPAQQQQATPQNVKPQALASLAPPPAEPVPMETPSAKPSSLIVNGSNEPVRAEAGKSVPLEVSLSQSPGAPETSVMVQGVPADSKLSQGKSLGSGNWLLSENDLPNLKLEAGTTLKPGKHVIEFIVVKSDGSVPTTRKISVMVEGPKKAASMSSPVIPVAAASQTAVARQTDLQQTSAPLPSKPELKQITLPALSPGEIKALLARGTSLLEEGDVAGARLLLEYAAQRGSKEAMVKLAQSYDPDHLLKLAVHGVKPDSKMSTHWYERAKTAQR